MSTSTTGQPVTSNGEVSTLPVYSSCGNGVCA